MWQMYNHKLVHISNIVQNTPIPPFGQFSSKIKDASKYFAVHKMDFKGDGGELGWLSG